MALIPDSVRSLVANGLDVVVEAGAGDGSGHPDPEYVDAGASVGSADDACHRREKRAALRSVHPT